jgi:hypothetical protein
LLDIQTYLNRFLTFVRKQNKPTAQFDYVESAMIVKKSSSTQTYNFDNGDDTIIQITDLLFYPISKDSNLLLVGTTSGLFVIQEQTPIKLTFPKSMWTVGQYIESIRLINHQPPLIAMNVLGLDQICCFDVEQSLSNQQLHIVHTLPNPYRQIATKMAVYNSNTSFECIIGSDHGSFFYHQIRTNPMNKKTKKPTFETKTNEIPWPQMKNSTPPSLLSSSLNEHYLCLTTTNNLICIYKRK